MLRSFLHTLGLALVLAAVASAALASPMDNSTTDAAVQAVELEPIDFDELTAPGESQLEPAVDGSVLNPWNECIQGLRCVSNTQCGNAGFCGAMGCCVCL